MVDSAAALLANPLVAIALGLLTGYLLLRNSRASFARMTPEEPVRGLVHVAVTLFLRLALATVLLWSYSRFIPEGYAPFALAMAGGFLSLFGVESIRYSGLLKRRRPLESAAKGGR